MIVPKMCASPFKYKHIPCDICILRSLSVLLHLFTEIVQNDYIYIYKLLFPYKRDAGSQKQDPDKQILKLLNDQLPDALT